MLYLVVVPIILLAVIVRLISDRYKIKSFSVLSTIVIILGVLFFIYAFADYNGYNIFNMLKSFFSFKK